MDQNAHRKAITPAAEDPGEISGPTHERPSGERSATGVAADLRGMTLAQLDEAFQAGSIDATTLVCLQCSDGVAAGRHSETSASAERRAEPHPEFSEPIEVSESASHPSPRTVAPVSRHDDGGNGIRVGARTRPGKVVQALAIGLVLSAIAASFYVQASGSRRTESTPMAGTEKPAKRASKAALPKHESKPEPEAAP